jgi:RND family efflux transporter MFP subunit
MPRTHRLHFTVCLLTAACLGCNQTTAQSTPSGYAGASPSQNAEEFRVVHPVRKAIPRIIEQPGAVFAFEETPLFAKLAGFVKVVHHDIGDRVKGPKYDSTGKLVNPGETLAELLIPELEDEAKQKDAYVLLSQAEEEQARRQADVGQANFESSEKQVDEARAGLKRAASTYERWQSEWNRIASLVRDKVIDPQVGDETKHQFQSAEAGRDEAQAKVASMEKAVIKAKAEWEKAKADVKAAAAKQQVAEADAARVHTLLEYRFIRAPFNGTVSKRKVDTGHFVQPVTGGKADPLFTVVRSDTVRVFVEVPEADAGLIRQGDTAQVTVASLSSQPFIGRVTRTAEMLEPGSRTLKVEIDLPNADGKIVPGMYAYARISVKVPENWVLPVSAVLKQADLHVCYFLQDNKAQRLVIKTGRTDGNFTEVLKKEKAGSANTWEDWTGSESVIAGPIATLKDGQSIQVKPQQSVDKK